jgi:diguanylate cyclase (GGDEF)-like protein/PAS domain S-box-containing protein
MHSNKLSKSEIERLISLKQYQILDIGSKRMFQEITKLASLLCGTPFASITLTDEKHEWHKNSFGDIFPEIHLEESLVKHEIINNDVFEAKSLIGNQNDIDKHSIQGFPNIQFYADVSLICDNGYSLGKLCIFDQMPRQLSKEQFDALKTLGHQIVTQIEHRVMMFKIEEMTGLLEKTGKMAHVGGWILDLKTMQSQWTKEIFDIHELSGPTPPSLEDTIKYYDPDFRSVILAAVKKAIAIGEPWDLELPFTTAKNNHLWVRTQGSAIFKNSRVVQLIGTLQNITDLKKKEFEFAWVNRALLILSKSNEALINIHDETKLIQEICRIIVEVGNYRMAWVGFAEDDDYKSIKPRAFFGINESNFLDIINLSWSSDQINGLGPGGRAVREGIPIAVKDLMLDPTYPVKEAAYEQGFMSLVSLPLKNKDKVYGILVMYASEVRDFTKQEINLLQELADNLAAGIINIKLEKERQLLNTAIIKLAKSVNVSTDDDFFDNLVQSMIETSGAQAGHISQLITKKQHKGIMLAGMVNGLKIDNYNFPVPKALTEALFKKNELFVATQNSYIDFPFISMMKFYQYQAFAALRLQDSKGKHVGLLIVLFQQPIQSNNLELIKSTLMLFAARAASELERMESNERIKEQASLLDKTHDAIIVRDMSNCITYWNKGAESLYGWKDVDAIDQPIQQLLKFDSLKFDQALKVLLEKDEWAGEMNEQHQDGRILEVESHWSLVRDSHGKPKSIFAIQTDITLRKQTENKIIEMAFYDGLTNLPNRRLLLDRLEKALASSVRSKNYGVLMFIDLDNFKIVNDTLGHDKGDKLLQEISKMLRICVRDEDTVARLGGDEFVIMIEDLSDDFELAKSYANMIGNKVLNELNQTFDFDGYKHVSTLSIGITLFNGQKEHVSQLVKEADSAMYKSKVAGRNRITFWNEVN